MFLTDKKTCFKEKGRNYNKKILQIKQNMYGFKMSYISYQKKLNKYQQKDEPKI